MTMFYIPPFVLGFSFIFFGYIIQSSFLQFFFYYLQAEKSSSDKWKIQSHTNKTHLNFFTIPLFSSKPDRGPYHRLLTTINILVASTFAGCVSHCLYDSELNPFSLQSVKEYGVLAIVYDLFIAFMYENIVEYYWHRLMHTRICYSYFHKYHHYYKAPEVWDDLYIHPIEAFGYYCILYSPPFIFHTHIYAFLMYMAIMGLCGVLDHSGIHTYIHYIYTYIHFINIIYNILDVCIITKHICMHVYIYLYTYRY